jgi:hypothetical protein
MLRSYEPEQAAPLIDAVRPPAGVHLGLDWARMPANLRGQIERIRVRLRSSAFVCVRYL